MNATEYASVEQYQIAKAVTTGLKKGHTVLIHFQNRHPISSNPHDGRVGPWEQR